MVNDLYDLENDRINKPERMTIGPVFSEDEAWRAFGSLFLAGGLIGLYLGWITGKWGYGSINLITGFWLFLYASDFKGRPLLGNLLISFLSAGVLTYPLFFDVLPLDVVFFFLRSIACLRRCCSYSHGNSGGGSPGGRSAGACWRFLATAFGWRILEWAPRHS